MPGGVVELQRSFESTPVRQSIVKELPLLDVAGSENRKGEMVYFAWLLVGPLSLLTEHRGIRTVPGARRQ